MQCNATNTLLNLQSVIEALQESEKEGGRQGKWVWQGKAGVNYPQNNCNTLQQQRQLAVWLDNVGTFINERNNNNE